MSRMTAEHHREIGRILGYPSCCVEAFIASPDCELARRNGGKTEYVRSHAEAAALDAEISALLGWTWRGCSGGDRRKHYILCDDCAERERANSLDTTAAIQ